MVIGIYEHKCGKLSPHYKHGLTGTRLYRIWSNMKNRCSNPKNNRAYIYIQRNITVCDEWKNDFQAFYNWSMSHGYSDELTLDRIDNDKGYSPNNCRWVNGHMQNINKRNVPTYEYNGITFHQCEVFELFGVKRTTFQMRLKRGWTVEESIRGEKNRTREAI